MRQRVLLRNLIGFKSPVRTIQVSRLWLYWFPSSSLLCCSLKHVYEYAISQLRIVRSGLHLVTYLDVGNFCDKSTEKTLYEICLQVYLRFSDSIKPSQSVSSIYELTWLAGIGIFEENLLKTLCKVAPLTKVAHIIWWRHDNRKQSASARERWCDVSCDIPYCFEHIGWKLSQVCLRQILVHVQVIEIKWASQTIKSKIEIPSNALTFSPTWIFFKQLLWHQWSKVLLRDHHSLLLLAPHVYREISV